MHASSTAVGGKLILMHKWNPEEALEIIERERPTTFTGVPTMARELVNSPDFAKRDTSSLDSLGGGGAAVQPDLVHKIEERLEGRPSTGYGLTEVNGVITVNAAHFFLAKPESAGSPCPVMESRIVDEQGNDLPTGEKGELWVKGGNVFRGYLNRPEATKKFLLKGGSIPEILLILMMMVFFFWLIELKIWFSGVVRMFTQPKLKQLYINTHQ